MGVLFANRFKTTISAGVTAAATVLPLSSVTLLPAIGGGNYCYLTLVSADQQTIEVVKATAVAGNNVTVTRAQEGTAAVAWAQGTPAELRLTTQSLLDALAERLGVSAAADAALKLVTPRSFSITGDVSWTVNFDGSADVTAAGTIAAKAVGNGKLADMAAAGFKGATAAGAVTDLTVGDARTMLSITNVENKSSATIRSEITSANVTGALGFTPEVAGACITQANADGRYLQLSGGTITDNVNFAASKGFIIATPGTTSIRVKSLPGIADWGGFFLNAAFNGAGWTLDDATKNGWFFKLDARSNAGGILNGLWVYRIPTGAGSHSDETPKFGITTDFAYIQDALAIGYAPAAGLVSAPTAGYKLDINGTIKASGVDVGGVAVALSNHNHAGTYEPVIGAGTAAQYWRGDKSWQTLNAAAVGLGSVENKSSATIRGELTSANVTTALGFTPESTIAAGTAAQYWRGDKSWQTLNAAAVGLGSVENKSSATIRSEITSANVTGALGYTPANNASLAAVATSGSASDLGSGTLGSARLPVQGFTIGVQGKGVGGGRYPTKAPYAFTPTTGNSSGTALVAAAASTVYTLKKGTVAAPTTVGTYTFAAGGTVATVSMTGSIGAGDTVWIEEPATADANLSDPTFLVRA